MAMVRKGSAVVNNDRKEYEAALERKQKRQQLERKIAEIDVLKSRIAELEKKVLFLQTQINQIIEK